jgi:rhodanese-related sulfurtransferase
MTKDGEPHLFNRDNLRQLHHQHYNLAIEAFFTMATSRISPLLLRSFRTSIPQLARAQRPLPSTCRPIAILSTAHSRLPRFYSSSSSQDRAASKPSKIYSFEDVRPFPFPPPPFFHQLTPLPQISQHILSPSPKRILIDTREPAELQTTGAIPGALNVPITSSPDAFFISSEEFEDRFGFERPGKDKEVVFYCKSGVRSRAAAELAKAAGWTEVGEYPGSWMDWEGRGGVKEGGRS